MSAAAELSQVRAALARRYNLDRTNAAPSVLVDDLVGEVLLFKALTRDPKWLQQLAPDAVAAVRRELNAIVAKAKRAAEVAETQLEEIQPLADHGSKFTPGRPRGAKGAIRLVIEKVLKANPNATADDVWNAVERRPPTGYRCEGYLEGRSLVHKASGKKQAWGSFRNACSAARKSLGITV